MRTFQFAVFPFFIMLVSGNTPPMIIGPFIKTIPEDLLVGSFAFRINATDRDGDSLTYSLGGEKAYFFKTNSSTGEVKIGVQLDYETLNQFAVTMTVQDSTNTPVSRPITILVENSNDNVPIFHNTPYSEKIPENQANGTVLFNVFATDLDDGPVPVKYSIDEVTPSSAEDRYLFYIETNGSVILNGTLNYNSKSIFYQLKIRATDAGGTFDGTEIVRNTTTYLSIDVVDVPDLNPQFLKAPYVASVPENSTLGTQVLTVSAIDADRGINDEIIYSIYNATFPGLFSINETSGEILVSGLIDREELLGSNEQILLVVVAKESKLNILNQTAWTSAEVTVQVMDINDNTPRFYDCKMPDCNFTDPVNSYVGVIDEHTSTRVPIENLTITAYDPDKESNGTFTLSLEGPAAASFSVSPVKIVNTSEVQIQVKDPASVDYETLQVMHVVIVANDSRSGPECCSFANVTINIRDINDHSPVFADTVYKLSVKERSPNGTPVGMITATDPDTGLFGKITYKLLPESILDTFQVNGHTGNVTVRNGTLLDRETRGVYYATLQALDGMNLTGTTLLEITVEDVNDNAPVITGSYNAFMDENTGTVRLQIQAFDNDEPNTNNSHLRYEILSSPYSHNFTIGQDSGLLTNMGSLDREAIDAALNGRIILTVRVYDLGVPQQEDFVNVTITVDDLNDNPPVFTFTNYEFNVTESEQGADVGSVEASDDDQTEINNRITFRILSGSSGTFLIRSSTAGPGKYWGKIMVDPDIALDYEVQKAFTLVIEAQDSGINNVIFSSTANASISVIDINDEPPMVDAASLQGVSVSENGTQHGLVTTLRAFDKDTQHLLLFQELAVACYKGRLSAGDTCQDWFQLYHNGSLFVNDSKAIDFETCDRVVLTLRVEDTLTQLGDRYSDNVTLTITIEDANDNAPVFLNIEDAFVVVPDVAPIEYQVAVVQATDTDTGQLGEVSFSIGSVDFILSSGASRPLAMVFKVVTTAENGIYTGSIRVASSLDSSLKGQYKVTVIAHDGGGLNTTKSLDIYAVDQTYLVSLKFSMSADKVRENNQVITKALVKATKATVYVSGIKDFSEPSRAARAAVQSVMEAYFVYKNGTAIMSEKVAELIQSDQESLSDLLQLGLTIIGGSAASPDNNEKIFVGIIAGLVGGLVLLALIMIVALVCTRKSYKRKLKAVKAMKEAKALPSNTVQGGPGIPGTNKYNMEGANPVLNLNIDSALDLGFDDHNSSSDCVSLNSLDEHFRDGLDEDARGIGYHQEPQNVRPGKATWEEEPLSAALKDHKPKMSEGTKEPAAKSNEHRFAFQNESLDTSDL
ncbi:cadherin-related family member 2 [Ambystoma mexicanum]|uniref:cadherin-related family member 2 n=1 Tax=Ambystoma mexicanum TaxID=8296 RepID=UPI0037E906EE